MSKTAPRADEEFARESFHQFLVSKGCGDPQWARGADPPDYELTLSTGTFPVEVTQIMSSRQLGKHSFSQQGWVAVLKQLKNRIEAEMKRRGILRGFYVLDLEPVPDLRQLESEILPAVERYLVATANLEIASSEVIFRHRGGIELRITKIANNDDVLTWSISTEDAKWQAEVIDEITQLLDVATRTKAEKTTHLQDVILLLIDVYDYGDSADWTRSAQALDLAEYHTVAIVSGNRECQVLYSRDVTTQACARIVRQM